MKKLQDWLRTWTIPQAIVAGVALVCVTALAITITVQDDWGKLFRWLADPATSGLLISIATLAGVLYHRALGLPPTLLALALLGTLAVGCGGALTDAQRADYAAEVQRCEANEAAIIARTGSTYAADQRDLEAERARCDAARAAIEHSQPDGGQ